ncbi:MAG: hypothetical protein AAFR40_02955, partial [Pseudomonadota bacterium]
LVRSTGKLISAPVSEPAGGSGTSVSGVALPSRPSGSRLLLRDSQLARAAGGAYATGMLSTNAQMPVLDDHARLPWRFFGDRMTLAAYG